MTVFSHDSLNSVRAVISTPGNLRRLKKDMTIQDTSVTTRDAFGDINYHLLYRYK